MDKYAPEASRLTFLRDRGGLGEAMEFAQRTMVSYRRLVLERNRSKEDRRTFIESYLAFKRFLRDHK